MNHLVTKVASWRGVSAEHPVPETPEPLPRVEFDIHLYQAEQAKNSGEMPEVT